MSQHVAMSKKPPGRQSHIHKAHHPYYYRDPHFMDIAEAESHRLLPDHSSQKPLTPPQDPSTTGSSLKRCTRTLTYALETSNAGLGHTLLTLWLAYGLAQSEDRAFFVDDTNWPYGSYGTYFKLPPSPGCLPPPKTQVVPCPHQARHLLVSAATTRHTFGHMFMDHFEDARKMGVMRQHKVFGMMRIGYEALFQGKLNDEDEAYFRDRVAELDSSTRIQGGEEIGVHVRHGDRHPLEYQYQKSYIPLEKYLDTAYNLSSQWPRPASSPTHILIASDDPDVYVDPLITSASAFPSSKTPTKIAKTEIEKAQSHISLASKKTLAASGKTGLGWEGGFFKDVFWALGAPPTFKAPDSIQSPPPSTPPPHRRRRSSHARDTPPKNLKRADLSSSSRTVAADLDLDLDLDPHTHPSSSALKLRQLVGRAYLLDLAVLGQSDRVVCALSAYGCRILAVMMGWERAIVDGGWINVDGDFDWRGVDW
jgi:hypothetical protein